MTGETVFIRLDNGVILERQADGSYRPVTSATDWQRIDQMKESEIEAMAASDPDHPALDAAFWEGVDIPPPGKQAISIKLDRDVLAYFKAHGEGYQTRINAVLRRYMEAMRRNG